MIMIMIILFVEANCRSPADWLKDSPRSTCTAGKSAPHSANKQLVKLQWFGVGFNPIQHRHTTYSPKFKLQTEGKVDLSS